MKKLIMALALVVGLSTAATAQFEDFTYNVKGGVNYFKLVDGADYKVGFEGGAGLVAPLTQELDLRVDAIIRYATSESNSIEYKQTSIVIPAVVAYNFTDEFSLFGGLELGYLLAADAGGTDVKDSVKDFNFGLVAGGTYSVDQFDINLAYSFGLTDLNDSSDTTTEVKPQGIILSGAYNF